MLLLFFFPTNWDKHLFFTKELNDTQTFVQRNMVFFSINNRRMYFLNNHFQKQLFSQLIFNDIQTIAEKKINI